MLLEKERLTEYEVSGRGRTFTTIGELDVRYYQQLVGRPIRVQLGKVQKCRKIYRRQRNKRERSKEEKVGLEKLWANTQITRVYKTQSSNTASQKSKTERLWILFFLSLCFSFFSLYLPPLVRVYGYTFFFLSSKKGKKNSRRKVEIQHTPFQSGWRSFLPILERC